MNFHFLQGSFRRRIPSIGRRTRPPHPCPSPHRRTLTHRRLKKPSKPVRILHRCPSEPILWTVSFFVDGDENRNLESDGVLFRPQTCIDVLAMSSFCSSLLSLSPQNQEDHGYSKHSPIRTMVPLGSSVDCGGHNPARNERVSQRRAKPTAPQGRCCQFQIASLPFIGLLLDVTILQPFNILRYEIGQRYNSHYDAFNPADYGPQSSERVASFLLYLSDVEEGGEIMFPFEHDLNIGMGYDYKKCIGLKVKPQRGDGLLFYSVFPNGTIDRTSLHGSCPVIAGEKWVATKWIRDEQQED